MRYHVQGIGRAAVALAVAGLFAASAQAATVEFSFNNVIQTSSSMAGTAPWMDLKISDTASAGTLLFDLNSFNLIPNQRLTGLFLNLPTAITANLTSVSVPALSVTATNPANATPNNSPVAFVGNPANLSSNSAWSSTQNLTGATAQNGGSFDFYIKFPTSATAVSAGAGANPLGETFQLTFAGSSLPTAASFLMTSLPANVGKPSYYAVAAFTNSDGITGNAWISASPVPEPESLAMLLAGLAVVGAAARRRKPAAQA